MNRAAILIFDSFDQKANHLLLKYYIQNSKIILLSMDNKQKSEHSSDSEDESTFTTQNF